MGLSLAERFARYPLSFLPSPIHRLDRLSKALGVEVWAKRDDISSGLAFGGNKIRKLEFLVAAALKRGCESLVSIGRAPSRPAYPNPASGRRAPRTRASPPLCPQAA